jgi:hypothetical protein
LQLCPVLLKQCRTPRFTAFSSASAKIRFAPLPPSSRCTCFSVSAAFFEIRMPARVEPVKEIMSMPGWPDISVPTPAPSPFTRLKTPGGMPAASTISANRSPDSGATSEGFSTIVQPAASAGPTFSAIWFIGQFHGVIMPTTPIGSIRMRVPGACGPSGRSHA